jgi:hydroxypyruvate isomerase
MLRSVSLQFMWTDRPFPDRVAAAAAAGFDLVDLWDWRTDDISAIATAAKDNGIGLNGFFGNRQHAACDPSGKAAFLEELKQSLDCAVTVGARQLHIFSNAIRPGGIVVPAPPVAPETLHAAGLDAMNAAAVLVAGSGVTLVLEHLNTVFLPGYLWSDAGLATAVCRQLDRAEVRVAFDAFHQQLSGGRLTDHLIASLDVLGRFDVAGVPGRTEPGIGEVDFSYLRSVLIEHGWDGTVTFEITPSDGNPDTAIAGVDKIFPADERGR